MPQEIGSRVEAELAIERLMDKFGHWLLQQPETLLIWTQDRDVRKEAARALADCLTTIPTRDNADVVDRATRRRIVKALNKAENEWWKGVKL